MLYPFMTKLLTVGLLVGSAATAHASADLNKAIDVAGRQRMLSQKMVKEILYVYNDIDAVGNLEKLTATSNLYDTSLGQLTLGDKDAGVPRISDAAVFTDLAEVTEVWTEVKGLIHSVLDQQKVSKNYLPFLNDNSMKLLKESNDVVQSMVKTTDKNESADKGEANTVNIAGRQRMLSQKMTKEFLFIKAGYEPEASQASLVKTVDLFDTSLAKLKSGDADSDIIAPPSDAIAAQLDVVAGIWDKINGPLRNAASGGAISAADAETVSSLEGTLLKEMNKAVQMY